MSEALAAEQNQRESVAEILRNYSRTSKRRSFHLSSDAICNRILFVLPVLQMMFTVYS